MRKSPYAIIKNRYITEKASVLSNLADSESSASLKRCKTPKAVYLVDIDATKPEIAQAIEKIYEKKKVKVIAVNTLRIKPKHKRRRTQSARDGRTKAFKKAVVTFAAGTNIDETA